VGWDEFAMLSNISKMISLNFKKRRGSVTFLHEFSHSISIFAKRLQEKS
jgi:hypothetical protein